MKLFDDLTKRELVKQITSPKVEELLNESKITFYCGFDPTADSLHVGSLLPLITMKRLMDQGHKPLVLVGGATGFVGDPSFKATERPALSAEQISENLKGISKNIAQILPNAEVVNNFDWIKEISLLDFLRFQGKMFSVNNMMSKDSVKSRIEDPKRGISFTEFTYQLLQAEDFRHLFIEKNCIFEIGGSDQWSNIVSGIDLIRRTTGKESFGMTIPLLLKSDGTKFGKSEKGNVWLSKDKTSVFDFFQFFVNTEDADVVGLLKKLTFLSLEEIAALEDSVKTEPHLRKAQLALAKALTTTVHGQEEMEKALEKTQSLFSSDASADAPPDLELTKSEPVSVIDLLMKTGLCSSKGQSKRDMAGGGIRINNQKELEDRQILDTEKDTRLILSKGKSVKKIIVFN